MHPFSIPWKHLCFQGVDKGCIGNKWDNTIILRWFKLQKQMIEISMFITFIEVSVDYFSEVFL